MRTRSVIQYLLLAALAVASVSCGDVVRSSRSPSMLVVNALLAAPGSKPGAFSGSLASSIYNNVTSPAPCSTSSPCRIVFSDTGQVVLAVALKDVTVTPTTNNQVTVTRYHVAYRRADGRNIEGIDVPYAFDGALTVTIPAGGTATASFELVRNIAKQESPLIQLNANSAVILTTIADVTFYGTDQTGNDLSVTGSILIDFGNFSLG